MSSSIERLSFTGHRTKLNRINPMFEYTPRLQHLSIEVDNIADDYFPAFLPTLCNLNFVIHNCETAMVLSCLRNMPNLYRLNVRLTFQLIDGNQWQDLISNSLPKFKLFKLAMAKYFSSESNIEKQMKNLIDEHQWFVGCFFKKNYLRLYTLPKRFSSEEFGGPDIVHSTHLYDNPQWFWNGITKIPNQKFFNHPIRSDIRLTNINDLSIESLIYDQFWSIVSDLHNLHTLTIYVDPNTSQAQLQTLLDYASNLFTLTFLIKPSFFTPLRQVFQPWHLQLLQCTCISLRHPDISRVDPCSTNEEFKILTHSTLLTQETGHEIPNLDQMIERLKERLPSIYLIYTGPDLGNRHFLIWK